MGIRINTPGILTTIQDLGRLAGIAAGFSPSGVMDQQAAKLANILLDNDLNEAVLEYSILGPSVTFSDETVVALTGGSVDAKLNGSSIAINQAFKVNRNDRLEIGPLKQGRYGYLAVHGGLAVRQVLGSYATSLRYHLGGFKGRALMPGDFIATRESTTPVAQLNRRRLTDVQQLDQQEVIIRVTPGPQYAQFSQQAIQAFQSQIFTVSKNADRMGIRLSSTSLPMAGVPEMLSEATVFGGIQVPQNGQPIVLMADRQTTGGYPVIAVVAMVDLSQMVQVVPGQTIRFKWVNSDESQRMAILQAHRLDALRHKLQQLHAPIQRRISTKISQLF